MDFILNSVLRESARVAVCVLVVAVTGGDVEAMVAVAKLGAIGCGAASAVALFLIPPEQDGWF